MKLTVFLLVMSLLQVNAKSYSQNINLNAKQAPFEKVLQSIEDQTGYVFIYDNLELKSTKVSLVLKNATINEALNKVLEKLPLTFKIIDKNIVITQKEESALDKIVKVFTPPLTVKGQIQTEGHYPLPNAIIRIKGNKTGVVSNANGEFEIADVPEDAIIQISFVGYKKKEIPASQFKNGRLEIVIEIDRAQLNEVNVQVSNGYNAIPLERATGSFGVMTAKQLEKIPSPNILQRMEGLVPGLNITLNQSDASFTYKNIAQNTVTNGSNSSYKIQIRGLSTLNANTAPLIVVDGVITDLDLRTFNPNDVEQITVLKDAAAASIWGIRAANGVLVIETKKGALSNKTNISFSGYFNISGKPRLNYIPQMNAAETIDYEQDLVDRGIITDPLLNTSTPPRYLDQAQEYMFQYRRGNITLAQRDARLAELSKNNSYDDISKYLLQRATSQQYNLNISGGGATNTYYYSASYAHENTNEIGTDGRRLNFTANNNFKLFKVATLSTSFKTSLSNFGQNGIGFNTLAPSPIQLMPYDRLVDANGKSVNYSYAYYYPVLDDLEKKGYLNWRYNYIDELDNSNRKIKENTYQLNLALTVPVYKGISFHSLYSFEKSFQNGSYLSNENTYSTRNMINNVTSIAANNTLVYGIPKGSILSTNNFNQDNYVVRNQLGYNSVFSNKHIINAIAGIELRQTTQSTNSYTYYGYNDQAQSFIPLQQLNNIRQAVTGFLTSVGNSGSIFTDISRRFLSYYGNASYTFNNKYTVSGSARLDDYNNFGLDKQFRRNPLWSSGLSWRVSEESFLKQVPWISTLSARLTYGVNGNISLNSLPFTTFSTISNDPSTQQPFVRIFGLANPSFRWEKTKVLNGGVNFGLFKSRLNGSVDYYLKRGSDLLYQYVTDPTFGSESVFRNGAKLDGRGIDINLNVVVLHSDSWTYTPSVNFSYNTNKVESLPVSRPILQSGYVGYLQDYSTDYLFVYRWAGLDKTGQPQIFDQNGNILNNKQPITSRDVFVNAGRTSPPIFGSITQNLKYKNFNLFVQIVGTFDYVFLRRSLNRYQTNSFYSSLDLSKDIADRWRKPGDEAFTNVPGLTGINSNSLDRYSNSDMMVAPADNIRIRQASLSYSLPEQIVKNLRMSSISFTAGVRDLGIIWKKNKYGIDPNYQPSLATITNLPPAASFNFALNANF